jgi:CRP/FNR family cyclic AMP-dependent transcriptional regulator
VNEQPCNRQASFAQCRAIPRIAQPRTGRIRPVSSARIVCIRLTRTFAPFTENKFIKSLKVINIDHRLEKRKCHGRFGCRHPSGTDIAARMPSVAPPSDRTREPALYIKIEFIGPRLPTAETARLTCDEMTKKTAPELFDPKIFLAKVGEGKTVVEFQKNQSVFSQGDVADTVFYIQKGRIKLTVTSELGKEAVVAILGPGEFFGEGCMNGHSVRIATTTAMEICLITAITKAAMIATLHSEPAFSELFIAYLLTRNSRVEEDLIDQLFNSSEKRLARLLLLLANFGKEGKPQPISPNVSQETLAEMIGTTRSRVSHFMNKFRRLGLISYNGKIEVHSSLMDAVLRDKPELKEEE